MKPKQKKVAICAGSFDPLTVGHVDIISRGLRLFDQIVVAVAINPAKNTLFSLSERVNLIETVFASQPGVLVTGFEGLLTDFAKKHHATALLRGLRNGRDFEYELPMVHMNEYLSPGLETVFLATDPQFSHVSSSLIKEVASLGGDFEKWVPKPIYLAMKHKLSR